MSDLEKLFSRINLAEKADFLWELLQNDEKIKKMFMEKYIHEWEAIRINEPEAFDMAGLLAKIKAEALIISEELSQLDFEELDWGSWEHPGYYVPDYEAAQLIAEEMADQAIEGIVDNLKKELEFGNLTSIVFNLASTVHGIYMAELHDPDGNLSDYPNEYFIEKVKGLLKEEKNNLATRKFLTSDFCIALELLLTFQKDENCENILYPVFADFFLTVMQNPDHARFFWNSAQKYGIPLSEYPALLNRVLSLSGEKKLWLKAMEGIFLQDYQTSEDLMAYYFESDPGNVP